MIVDVLAIAETLAPKTVARKIAARMLLFHGYWARSFSVRISTAAAPVFKWIVNWQRVIPHKSIGAIGTTVSATEHCLHISGRRATDGERADSAHIKIVRQ